jgi:hypothetical protein
MGGPSRVRHGALYARLGCIYQGAVFPDRAWWPNRKSCRPLLGHNQRKDYGCRLLVVSCSLGHGGPDPWPRSQERGGVEQGLGVGAGPLLTCQSSVFGAREAGIATCSCSDKFLRSDLVVRKRYGGFPVAGRSHKQRERMQRDGQRETLTGIYWTRFDLRDRLTEIDNLPRGFPAEAWPSRCSSVVINPNVGSARVLPLLFEFEAQVCGTGNEEGRASLGIISARGLR